MDQQRWSIRNQVMSEVLDGEAVIIDMASGRYHAASGVAGTIWQAIGAGFSFAAILNEVLRCHSGVPADAAETIKGFIGQLMAANLVQEDAGETADQTISEPAGKATQWAPPVLESHDDLQDLLLLDPVHEVTEAGWPHAAPPQA